METAEDKIDVVLKEVKNLTITQLKLTTTMDDLHKRNINAEKMSTDLTTELKSLTSRLEALEAHSKAPTLAPRREARGAGQWPRQHYQSPGYLCGGSDHPEFPGQG
ncbi:unnamed protein product [Urochloa humidicola]